LANETDYALPFIICGMASISFTAGRLIDTLFISHVVSDL